MNERGIAIEGLTIVIRGAFNPAIFTPSWFRDQDLIGVTESEAQTIELITREVAVFSMGWLQCHATADALQLSTEEPEEFERLRDVAIGVLRILSHTPLSALGINRDFHTTMKSIDQWHAIGDAIVPKDIWEEDLLLPGMRSATLWGRRSDGYTGHFQVQVEPSVKLPLSVFVATNDHFALTTENREIKSREAAWDIVEEEVEATAAKIPVAIEVLLSCWDDVLSRAEKTRRRVVMLADGAS